MGVHSLCHCLMPSLPWGTMSDPGPDSQGRRQGRVRKEQILFGEIIGEQNRKSPKWDCVWRSRHLPGIRTWDWEWAGLSQPPGRCTCHRDAHLPEKLRGYTSHFPVPSRGLWSAPCCSPGYRHLSLYHKTSSMALAFRKKNLGPCGTPKAEMICSQRVWVKFGDTTTRQQVLISIQGRDCPDRAADEGAGGRAWASAGWGVGC